MRVRVVAYNPAWPALFEQEAQALRSVMGRELIALFHIGSTSVPGLAAKPVIDILPVVHSVAALDGLSAGFEALGYEVMGELGIPGRRFYRKGGEERTHHVHAFQCDNSLGILRHVAFRDYLRAHPAVRREYGDLKIRLAALYPWDIEAYMDGKDAFVKKHEALALQWVWQSWPR